VQERRNSNRCPVVVRYLVIGAKLCQYPRRKVARPERVRKARVFGGVIGNISQSQLPYPAQPLELGGVDEPGKQPSLIRIHPNPDYVMNRVAVDSVGQIVIS